MVEVERPSHSNFGIGYQLWKVIKRTVPSCKDLMMLGRVLNVRS